MKNNIGMKTINFKLDYSEWEIENYNNQLYTLILVNGKYFDKILTYKENKVYLNSAVVSVNADDYIEAINQFMRYINDNDIHIIDK